MNIERACFNIFFIFSIVSQLSYAQDENLKEEILKITNSYNRAWESLDWEEVSKYHDTDILYYWRGKKGPSNKIEFDKLLQGLFSRMNSYSHKMIDPQLQILNDTAVVISHEVDGDYVGKDGIRVNYDGALTYVFQRKEDGWKIVLIHESSPVNY